MRRPDLSRAAWRKSSRSGAEHNCVELARTDGNNIAIRDSKNPHQAALLFDRVGWSDFARQAKRGTFDSPS